MLCLRALKRREACGYLVGWADARVTPGAASAKASGTLAVGLLGAPSLADCPATGALQFIHAACTGPVESTLLDVCAACDVHWSTSGRFRTPRSGWCWCRLCGSAGGARR